MTSLYRAAFVQSGETHAQAQRSDLRRQLRKAERRNLLSAYGLVLPLFAFVLFGFLMPLGIVLWNSVYDPQVGDGMPRTIAALKGWSPHQSAYPDEAVFAALAQDMKAADENQSASTLASRLNFEAGGLRTLFMRTTREIVDIEAGPWTARFMAIDSRWAQPQTWAAIQQAGHRYTVGYYLKALDLRQDRFGEVVRAPEDSRIHLDAFGRTLVVGATVAMLCLLLGYPVAHLLSRLKPRHGNLLMICVLLPFWTSLLVRTTAWIVLLQKDGLVNSLLMTIGLADRPLDLMYNRFGVVLAMTHILLPFTVLPMYSVMKMIPTSYVRAARSLGATPWTAFWKVYFPQSLPGISAGGMLVFILAIGYYITPSLLGGAGDQMISAFIADNISRSLNWGLASALGGILLAGVLAFYAVYEKYVGMSNVKFA